MLYFVNPSTPPIRAAITGGVLACMIRPGQGNRLQPGWTWAADNGRVTGGGYPVETWKAAPWVALLERHQPHQGRCVFAAVPDQPRDCVETDRLWDTWAPIVRELGYPAAYVAQDGCWRPPWAELDVLFIGGSTAWKVHRDAWALAAEARERGVPVHWGRVNSRKRFTMAAQTGDTADGTFLTFGPDRRLPELVGWLNTLDLNTTPPPEVAP